MADEIIYQGPPSSEAVVAAWLRSIALELDTGATLLGGNEWVSVTFGEGQKLASFRADLHFKARAAAGGPLNRLQQFQEAERIREIIRDSGAPLADAPCHDCTATDEPGMCWRTGRACAAGVVTVDPVRDAARQLRKALSLSQDFDDWPLEKLMQKAAERIAANGVAASHGQTVSRATPAPGSCPTGRP